MTRLNVVLLVLFLALLGYDLFFVERTAHRGAAPTISIDLFPGFDPAGAERVEIRTPTNQIVLERADDDWIMTTSGDFPANRDRVGELLEKVRTLKKGNVASRNPDSHAQLQVEGSFREVRIHDKKDELIAQLYIGKLGPTSQSTFVRREGAVEVIQVLENLNQVFSPSNFAWFSKTSLLSFDPKLVNRLEWDYPDEKFIIVREEDGDWKQIEPLGITVDQALLSNLCRGLSSFRFSDVVGGDPKKHGFDTPALRFTVGLADGTSHTIIVGAELQDSANLFVQIEGEPYVYQVPAQNVRQYLLKRGGDLVDRTTATGKERIFGGPEIGPDFMRSFLGADIVVRGHARREALDESGNPVATEEGAETVSVPFDVVEVFKGTFPGSDEENPVLVVDLPTNRLLPGLLPAQPFVLILKKAQDGSVQLHGDPADTIFQPDSGKLSTLRQMVTQFQQAEKQREEAARKAAEKQKKE